MAPPRRFDHDWARQQYAAGETLTDIARQAGVTTTAITFVVNEQARLAQVARNAKRQTSGNCVDCGVPCSYNPHQKNRKSRGRCKPCAAIHVATSVRPATLQCSACRLWLPDEDFNLRRSLIARRGRQKVCRLCTAVMKRHWRAALDEDKRQAFREKDRVRSALHRSHTA